MEFINSRPFMKDNPKYLELRKLGFKSNFYGTVPLVALVQFNVIMFNLLPLITGKRTFGLPLYYGIDFEENAVAYYFIYIVSAISLYIAGSLIMNTCTFTSSLTNFLSLEFHILGLTYDEVFEGKIDENSLDKTYEDLKRNTIQHEMLLMYLTNVLKFCLNFLNCRNAEKLQDVLYLPMFTQLFASCLLIAMAGYQFLTTEFSLRGIIRMQHLIFQLVELFYYCRCGEKLKNEVFNDSLE